MFLIALMVLGCIPTDMFANVNDNLIGYNDTYDGEGEEYYDDSPELEENTPEPEPGPDHVDENDSEDINFVLPPEIGLQPDTARVSGIMPMSSVIEIETADQLEAFLRGNLGSNISTFVLINDIDMAGRGPFQGRGHVDGVPFTGVVQGSAEFYDINDRFPIISGLALTRRDAAEPSDTAGHNDFGFIRVLGQGAVIEDVRFSGVAFTDTASLAGWDTVVGSIGLVAGRVAPNSSCHKKR